MFTSYIHLQWNYNQKTTISWLAKWFFEMSLIVCVLSLLLGSSSIRHGKRCCRWHKPRPLGGDAELRAAFWLEEASVRHAPPPSSTQRWRNWCLSERLDGACVCMSGWRGQAVIWVSLHSLFLWLWVRDTFFCFQHLCPHHLEFTSNSVKVSAFFFQSEIQFLFYLVV